MNNDAIDESQNELEQCEGCEVRATSDDRGEGVDAASGARWISLADRVRQARKEAGVTQVDLARRMGKSQAFVSQAETGVNRIGQRYVNEVLQACGLPAGWGAPAEAADGGDVSETARVRAIMAEGGWPAVYARYAGLDPETFEPVLRNSARDLELREKYRWWTGEPSVWDFDRLT